MLQVALTLKRWSNQEEKNCGWGVPLPRRSPPHLCDQSRTSDHGLVDAALPLPAAAGILHGPRGALLVIEMVIIDVEGFDSLLSRRSGLGEVLQAAIWGLAAFCPFAFGDLERLLY